MSLPSTQDELIRLLLEKRLVSPEALREAESLLAEIASGHDGPIPDLGTFLVQQGNLSPEALRSLGWEIHEAPIPFGKYLRLSLLGSGAMGDVWKCYDARLHRWVALKTMKHRDPEETARFRREAQASAHLDHPSIATVFESGEIDGVPYIAMRLVRGRELREMSREDPRLLARLIRDAALGLHSAHLQGVVHRDIKPSNLLVEEGDPPRIVITDFGLAKQMDVASSLTGSGQLMGTPMYMAPEQAAGRLSQVGPRSDVYSLGATLYELLTGRPPFEGRDLYDLLGKVMEGGPRLPRAFDSEIDPDLETIVMKCLDREPRRRYASAERLAEDLTRWLSDEPIAARPASTVRRWSRLITKRRWLLGAAALGVVAVSLVALIWPRWNREKAIRRQREVEILSARKRSEDAAKAREQGIAYLESGRRILEQVRKRLNDPSMTRAERIGSARSALAELQKALDLSPDLAEAHLAMARTYLLMPARLPALRHMDRAIQIAPDFATAYLERASLNAEALENETQNPRDSNGQIHQLRQRVVGDLEQVRRLTLDSKETTYARALLQLASGSFESAREILAEIVSANPADWKAHYYLAVTWQKSARLDHAENSLNRAISWNLYDWQLFSFRGSLRFRAQRYREASEDYGRAIAVDPDYEHLYVYRGNVRIFLGDFGGAVQDADAALKLNPQFGIGYDLRARARGAMKDWKKAVDDETEAIRLLPDDAETHLFLTYRAQFRVELGETDSAIADYTSALVRKPDYLDGWLGRGRLHLRMNSLDAAVYDYSRAVDLREPNGIAYAGRARAHYLAGNRVAAIRDARAALELLKDEGEAKTMREILRLLGD